jgi:hypothetical protein
MPPGGPKFFAAELETLRKWIADGAHWPKSVELAEKILFGKLMPAQSDGAGPAEENVDDWDQFARRVFSASRW